MVLFGEARLVGVAVCGGEVNDWGPLGARSVDRRTAKNLAVHGWKESTNTHT